MTRKFLNHSLFVLALLLLPISSASALTTEPLFGEVFFGPATGETASGSFTYDETLLAGIGEEEISVEDGLTLEFMFLGKTFLETDDIDFPFLPSLLFFDGFPVALDYVVEDGDGIGTEIDDPRLDGFATFDLSPVPTGGFSVEVFTFLIPEPSTFVTLAIGSCLCSCIRRR